MYKLTKFFNNIHVLQQDQFAFDHPDASQQDKSTLLNPLLTCRVLEDFLMLPIICFSMDLCVNVVEVNLIFFLDIFIHNDCIKLSLKLNQNSVQFLHVHNYVQHLPY